MPDSLGSFGWGSKTDSSTIEDPGPIAVGHFVKSEVDVFARIERLGGPGPDDDFLKRESGGGTHLPNDALEWITRHSDHEKLSRPQVPDPHAAYFERTLP